MALFGLTPAKPVPTTPVDKNAVVFDVGMADFETLVLKVSMERPVLVDFWAPWCGPCKQLMPVLEAEVKACGGAVLLAKVNIDENPELAQALRIQSVPTVMAFFQGQPVGGFTGARPASDIKNLMAQLVALAKSAKPDAIDIPSALKQAAQELADGNIMGAQDLYIQILSQDEKNIDAYVGMVRCLVAAGAIEQAQNMVDGAPDVMAKNPALGAAKTALELAKGAGEALKKLKPLMEALSKNPDDHQARYDLACAQFTAGQKEQAIDNLLMIVKADRAWKDEAARKELLRFFEAMGFADRLSAEGRKKLSRLLFS